MDNQAVRRAAPEGGILAPSVCLSVCLTEEHLINMYSLSAARHVCLLIQIKTCERSRSVRKIHPERKLKEKMNKF